MSLARHLMSAVVRWSSLRGFCPNAKQVAENSSVKSLLVLVGALTAAASYGQTPAPAPLQAGPLTVTGSIRTRVESWDWFAGDADNTYTYAGSLIRLGIGESRKTYDWMLEFEAPFLLGLPDQAIALGGQGQFGLGATYFAANGGTRNPGMAFAKQVYFRFKALDGAHSLRFGRFEFIDGSETAPKDPTLAALKRDRIAHRLIGNFGWSHVGRSFDGLQYVYAAKTNVTVLGARPTRGVFQTDGWGGLNIGVGYASVTRPVTLKHSAGEWRLFGLLYEDWRDDPLKTDNRPIPVRRADHAHIRVTTFGGNYLHAFDTSAGEFDLLLWGALQSGRWGTLEQRSRAACIEAGYQPPFKYVKPWFRVGYNYL